MDPRCRWNPQGSVFLPLAIRIALLSLLPTAALLAISFWLATGVVTGESRTKALEIARERARQIALHWKQEGQQLAREASQTARHPAVLGALMGSSRAPGLASLPPAPGTAWFVVDTEGTLLAGLREEGGSWVPVTEVRTGPLVTLAGRSYRLVSAPVSGVGGESLGRVWLGQQVTLQGASLERAGATGSAGEDAVAAELEPGWTVRVPVPATPLTEAVFAGLARVFGGAALGSAALAVLVAWLLSRSVVRPLSHLAEQLRRIERTGVLMPEFDANSHTAEVRELAHTFNRAASSVVESRRRLDFAYGAFIETMAHALDARDLYTAGHSRRVSEYSCAIADTMRLSVEQTEIIRMGALLHDIGKIGVPDHILQKPGALTPEETEILRQHVTIGRRILEPCEGFQAYLPIIELHHENHDGTGYPWRLSGNEIPLEARIVHVADAYDAMTTDRPYRKGLPHETALERLRQWSGTQFAPEVIAAVERMVADGWRGVEHSKALSPSPSVFALARALQRDSAVPVPSSQDAAPRVP